MNLATRRKPSTARRGAFSGPTEAEIEQTCTALLELDGWRSLRTDPVSSRERGKGFGEVGMADHLYIRYYAGTECDAQVMWIEWKAPRTKVGQHQRLWIAAERRRGATVLLAGETFPRSIEGFCHWYLKESGLVRQAGLFSHHQREWQRARRNPPPTGGAA